MVHDPDVRDAAEEIEEALAAVARAISERLAATGWQHRDIAGFSALAGVGSWTRDVGNGVLASAEVARAHFQMPERWPTELRVMIGVGYEPALDLMPILTLPPNPILIAERTTIMPKLGLFVPLPNADHVQSAADRVTRFIVEHAVAFAGQFRDASAIEAERRPAAVAEPREGPDSVTHDEASRLRTIDCLQLVLLASMGRHTEVPARLAELRSRPSGRKRVARALPSYASYSLRNTRDVGSMSAPPR